MFGAGTHTAFSLLHAVQHFPLFPSPWAAHTLPQFALTLPAAIFGAATCLSIYLHFSCLMLLFVLPQNARICAK